MPNAPASDVAKNFGEWHEKAMADLDDIVTHGVETSDIPPEYRWNSYDEDVSDERRGAGQ